MADTVSENVQQLSVQDDGNMNGLTEDTNSHELSKSNPFDSDPFTQKTMNHSNNLDDLLTFDPGSSQGHSEPPCGFQQEPMIPTQSQMPDCSSFAEGDTGVLIDTGYGASEAVNTNPFIDPAPADESQLVSIDQQVPESSQNGGAEESHDDSMFLVQQSAGTDLMTGSFIGDENDFNKLSAAPAAEPVEQPIGSPFVNEQWAHDHTDPSPDKPEDYPANYGAEAEPLNHNNPFLDQAEDASMPCAEAEQRHDERTDQFMADQHDEQFSNEAMEAEDRDATPVPDDTTDNMVQPSKDFNYMTDEGYGQEQQMEPCTAESPLREEYPQDSYSQEQMFGFERSHEDKEEAPVQPVIDDPSLQEQISHSPDPVSPVKEATFPEPELPVHEMDPYSQDQMMSTPEPVKHSYPEEEPEGQNLGKEVVEPEFVSQEQVEVPCSDDMGVEQGLASSPEQVDLMAWAQKEAEVPGDYDAEGVMPTGGCEAEPEDLGQGLDDLGQGQQSISSPDEGIVTDEIPECAGEPVQQDMGFEATQQAMGFDAAHADMEFGMQSGTSEKEELAVEDKEDVETPEKELGNREVCHSPENLPVCDIQDVEEKTKVDDVEPIPATVEEPARQVSDDNEMDDGVSTLAVCGSTRASETNLEDDSARAEAVKQIAKVQPKKAKSPSPKPAPKETKETKSKPKTSSSLTRPTSASAARAAATKVTPKTAPTKPTPKTPPTKTPTAKPTQKVSPMTKPAPKPTRVPPRPSPATKTKKDASSDSGVEDDRNGLKKGVTKTTTRTPAATKTSSLPSATKTTPKRPDSAKSPRPTSSTPSPRTKTATSPRKPESSPRNGTTTPARPASGRPTSAKTPDTKQVKSKIGSMDNARHTPGGGKVKIQSTKLDFSNVQSKCGSKDNIKHRATGGDKKIESRKLDWKVESKVGSLDNVKHKAAGGEKKIESRKLEWNVQSKVGSMDNAKHKAGGGDKKIETQKLSWQVDSKIGSLENAQHTPGGGKVKILDEKLEWRTESRIGSLENARHTPGGGNVQIHNKKLEYNKRARSRIGSLENATHVPGGGDVKIHDEKPQFKERAHSRIGSLENKDHKAGGGDVHIESHKLDFKEKAASKVGSTDYITHQPGGGNKKIEQHKLDFKEKAHSKVGSLDNAAHVPGGGDVKIESHKVDFKERAESRVGSLDNAHHVPGGRDVKIESHKLSFSEDASPRTDSGDTY